MYYMGKLLNFTSFFKGKKSKQALEQELFSLENQDGLIKTPEEALSWLTQYVAVKKEYESQYGKWSIDNWKKWAKNIK